MAEVENLTTAAVAETPKEEEAVVVSKDSSDDAGGAAVLGTSPAQERSSNSHQHDSEYDTASDLEGGDEYDEDGESASEDEDDEDVEEGEVGEEERSNDHDSVAERAEELQKKVDEDRSNPQYIPKRGTFYEHDDRTAEGAENASNLDVDIAEVKESGGTNLQSAPTISQASKTMKKWQPASAVDRWSHDRFDPGEQAPKSRTELVSSYGYDIRNEDAPPRARRRRRYGRGPSKYLRNWEDETAYLKASNTPRKPPKPSDFPALNERNDHRRTHNVKLEKENRVEKKLVPLSEKAKINYTTNPKWSQPKDKRDVLRKDNKAKNYGRNQQSSKRQSAMEFKNKQRPSNQVHVSATAHSSENYQLEKHQNYNERNITRVQLSEVIEPVCNANKGQQSQQKHVQPQPNEPFNSNQEQAFTQMQSHLNPSSQNGRPLTKATPSNLSARLQQVQNRNDPSHVGSVQMHALASQNQLVAGQQQQTNIIIGQQPQVPAAAPVSHPDQGRPKRYSSIRRSQHDPQNLDQHQIQQIHMQQQVAASQPLILQDQHLLQANLMQMYHQENLQAQMQALQVSANPSTGQQNPTTYAAVAPPPITQQPQQPPPQPYVTAAVAANAPAAFYVTAPEAYAHPGATAASVQAPPTAQYAPQPPPNYLQNAAISAAPPPPLTYTTPPPPPQQGVAANAAVPVPATGPLVYGAPSSVPNGSQVTQVPSPSAPQAGQAGYQNYPNYQNYNTVGGTTYFVPPVQPTPRPVALPQRRPTNAIPILPPSEKNKQRNQLDSKEEVKNSNNETTASASISEDIDHIIDNMFVQRPAYQPPTIQPRKTSSSPAEGPLGNAVDSSNKIIAPPQSNCNEETSTEKQIGNESIENSSSVDVIKEVA